jgi:hypothetical protein
MELKGKVEMHIERILSRFEIAESIFYFHLALRD